MIVLNVILMLVIVVLLFVAIGARTQRNAARLNAARFEKQANEALAQSTKVARDNDDLRTRLSEQGKAWSAKLRNAQNRAGRR